MAFAFNFESDDIDGQQNNDGIPTHQPSNISAENYHSPTTELTDPPPEVPVRKHDLRDMLHTLPSQISYTTTLLTSPQQERRTLIPRRALFDVRLQIMAEPPAPENANPSQHPRSSTTTSKTNTATTDPTTLLLTDTDLSTSIYEGGFKTWECATDLARLVLERGPRKDIDELSRVHHVVELGAGTALPSLVLFQHALRTGLALPFTLADYNADVLRLVTLPNLLVTWAMEVAPEALEPCPRVDENGAVVDGDGELAVTEGLLERFVLDLEERGMQVTLLSGPWSPGLTRHLVAPLAAEMGILVLAAETIYSPVSMVAFAEVLVGLLRRVSFGKAFVAAKRVYFGVGGSVDAFKEEMSRRGALCGEVQNSGIEGCDRSMEAVQKGTGGGVGRCLLEVQMF